MSRYCYFRIEGSLFHSSTAFEFKKSTELPVGNMAEHVPTLLLYSSGKIRHMLAYNPAKEEILKSIRNWR